MYPPVNVHVQSIRPLYVAKKRLLTFLILYLRCIITNPSHFQANPIRAILDKDLSGEARAFAWGMQAETQMPTRRASSGGEGGEGRDTLLPIAWYYGTKQKRLGDAALRKYLTLILGRGTHIYRGRTLRILNPRSHVY
jgi:hypothetical protein